MVIKSLSFKIKTVSRGAKLDRNRSSVAISAYWSGEKLYDNRYKTEWGYSKKKSPYYSEIVTPTNAPIWAANRQELWNRVEESEKRRDARVCREFIVSLPNEISYEHRLQIARAFVQDNFTKIGIVVDIAYYNFTGEKSHNPYFHLTVTTRPLEGENFGNKDRSQDRKASLLQWRKSYMDICNFHLEKEGYSVRVTTESFKTRGLDLAPLSEPMSLWQMRKKHDKNPDKFPLPERAKAIDGLRQLNKALV